jgi:hypothetical protein
MSAGFIACGACYPFSAFSSLFWRKAFPDLAQLRLPWWQNVCGRLTNELTWAGIVALCRLTLKAPPECT